MGTDKKLTFDDLLMEATLDEEGLFEIAEESEADSKVFMFFSVDLVNSTKFKAKHPHKATPIVMEFYKTIKSWVSKTYHDAHIWKHVGDEVLFYFEINKIQQILKAPSGLHKIMAVAQKAFYNECDKIGVGDIVKNFLYFKGALWIAAAAKYGSEKKVTAPNIYTDLLSTHGELDFIGRDVDEGYRMSLHTSQGKLVIDPKIAYLLNSHEGEWHELTSEVIKKNLKIIDYIYLKGIWDGRIFPIIWYADDWERENLFLYDEKYTNALVEAYLADPKSDRSIKKIDQMFEDLVLPLDSVRKIQDILEEKKIESSPPVKKK